MLVGNLSTMAITARKFRTSQATREEARRDVRASVDCVAINSLNNVLPVLNLVVLNVLAIIVGPRVRM